MDKKKEDTISVKYRRSNEFKYIPATGAFGGPSPQGEIICNFFVENQEYPEDLKLILDPDTRKVIKESGPTLSEKIIIRELQIGLVMRPDIARIVGEWLIKEADKIIFKIPKKDKLI